MDFWDVQNDWLNVSFSVTACQSSKFAPLAQFIAQFHFSLVSIFIFFFYFLSRTELLHLTVVQIVVTVFGAVVFFSHKYDCKLRIRLFWLFFLLKLVLKHKTFNCSLWKTEISICGWFSSSLISTFGCDFRFFFVLNFQQDFFQHLKALEMWC